MRNRFTLSLTVIAGMLCAVTPALALPDPTQSAHEPLTTLWKASQRDERLAGVNFFVEYGNDHIVYASPANRKSQTGVFQSALPPQCDKLSQMYDLTYLLPDVPAAQYASYIKTHTDPFSPFFELTYGASMRNGTLLQGIATRIGQQQKILDAHRDLKVAFDTTEGAYNDAVAKRTTAQANIDYYQNRIASLTTTLSITSDPTVQQQIIDQIHQLQADRTEKLPALNTALRLAMAAVDTAFPPYNSAKAAWQQYDLDLTRLSNEVDQVSRILANLLAVYKQGFETSETTLNNFQYAVAGYASAAYTIYDQEVTATNLALADMKDANGKPLNYQATQVPLYDVVLAPQMALTTVTVQGAEANSPVASRTDGVIPGPNPSTLTPLGTPVPAETGLTNDDGTPLTSKSGNAATIRKFGTNQGAGSYRGVVTRGAYCAGTSEAAPVKINAPYDLGDGVARAEVITKPTYKARTSNVLAQAVALNYSYYVQAEPIGVHCTMNTSKFVDFVQNQSDIHVFFWGKKTDEATRNQRASSGIDCTVDVQPTSGDPVADAAYVRQLQATYTKDMAEEFLRLAASSWDTQKINDPSSLLPAERKPGQALSDAVQCDWWQSILSGGGCNATKAALKATDELFGFREGKKSIKDSLNVTIRRNYSERSYRRVPGSAAINLIVPVSL